MRWTASTLACLALLSTLAAKPVLAWRGPGTSWRASGRRYRKYFLCLVRGDQLLMFRRLTPTHAHLRGATRIPDRTTYQICGHEEDEMSSHTGALHAINYVDFPIGVRVRGSNGAERTYLMHGHRSLPDVVYIDVKNRQVRLKNGYVGKLLGFTYNPKWMAVETTQREWVGDTDGFGGRPVQPIKSRISRQHIDLDLWHHDFIFNRGWAKHVPALRGKDVLRNAKNRWQFELVNVDDRR